MPVRIFESIATPGSRRDSLTENPTATVRNVRASDLTDITSRAQQRQQQILQAQPGSDRALFPVQSTNGALPSLLPGASVDAGAAPANTQRAGAQANQLGARGVDPGNNPQRQENVAPQPRNSTTRLADTGFNDLNPTQRLEAYRTVFADNVDAVVGEDGSFETTQTGTPLVAFQPRDFDGLVQVAQDAVPAHSIFAEAVRRLGVQASPAGSTDYGVSYAGSPEAVVALARKFGASVTQNEAGISVEFNSTHPLNTQFHEAPFAEREREGPDPRLRRFL